LERNRRDLRDCRNCMDSRRSPRRIPALMTISCDDVRWAGSRDVYSAQDLYPPE
jgi:hypothetical protein